MTKAAAKFPDRLAFQVLQGPWSADGGEEFTDYHELDDPSEALLRAAAGAHAAGVIEVTEGLVHGGVQSQEEGEAAYEAAQASGDWQVGNELQHRLEQSTARLARAESAVEDDEDDAPAELKAAKRERAELEAEIGGLAE